MPNNTSYVAITPEQIAEVKALCPSDTSTPWFVSLNKEQIPSVFPEKFREKFDHAVMMGSGNTLTGSVYVVLNGQRVDERDRAIDQEPFGILLSSNNSTPSGVFIHHGDWPGRTEKTSIPREFWQSVQESGIGNYYPPPSMQQNSSGTLDSIPSNSNRGAFNTTVGALLRFDKFDSSNSE